MNFPKWITSSARTKRVFIGAAILIFLYALLGFFVAPVVLKSHLISGIGEHLHRQATIEKIKLNPFAHSVTVRGFKMKESDGIIHIHSVTFSRIAGMANKFNKNRKIRISCFSLLVRRRCGKADLG